MGSKSIDGVQSASVKEEPCSNTSFSSSIPAQHKSGNNGNDAIAGGGSVVDGRLSVNTSTDIVRDTSAGALIVDDGIVDFRIDGDDDDIAIRMTKGTTSGTSRTIDLNEAIVPNYHPQHHVVPPKVLSVRSTTSAFEDRSCVPIDLGQSTYATNLSYPTQPTNQLTLLTQPAYSTNL